MAISFIFFRSSPDALARAFAMIGADPECPFKDLATQDGAPVSQGGALILFNHEPVGFIEYIGEEMVELHKIYITPTHRRRGLGKAAADHLFALAKGDGAMEGSLQVLQNADSQALAYSILKDRKAVGFPENKWIFDL